MLLPRRAPRLAIVLLRRLQHSAAAKRNPFLPQLEGQERSSLCAIAENRSPGSDSFCSSLLLQQLSTCLKTRPVDAAQKFTLRNFPLQTSSWDGSSFTLAEAPYPQSLLKPQGLSISPYPEPQGLSAWTPDHHPGDSSGVRWPDRSRAYQLPSGWPATSAEGGEEPLQASSVKKKRRLKMNKHKQRKLRRRERHRNK